LDRLETVQRRNLPIAGTLVLSAQGHGTLKQPQLDAKLAINHLRISNQAVPQFQAQLNVANQQADFILDSQIADGFVQAKGNVNLAPDYYMTASLDTRAFPLGPLFATYLPGQAGDLQGQTELHAWLKGPLKDVSRVQGQLELPTLNLAYKSVQISNAGPIRVKYESGVVELAPAELKGTGTDLHLQGTVPVKSQAPLNFQASGTADLALIRSFASDLDSSGKVDLNLSARGDKAHPEVQGNLRIVNAAFSSSSSPMGLGKINGQLQIQSDRIQITQLTGEAGGGTIAAQGSLAYRPQMAFNLGLTANSIRVRYPQGVRAILDGKIALNGTAQDSTLSGQVSVDRLSFTNEFDLASFMSQFSDESPTTSSTGFEQNMHLKIAVQSAQQLALASSKLSVEGSTNLRVTGTAANPVILGRTTLTGGELFFLGNRYQIQNGVINFANPIRTEPVVNLNVATRVKQYNITLNFVGPVDRLRTTYVSDPGLPPADIISLLAFGKTTEEAATSPSTPASLGAESVVAQRVSGTVSGQVEKLAGISQLQIDPLVGGDQRDPGARLAIQQHVTSNILFSFTTDVTTTQREIIRIEYQTKRKLGISVLRDENGGFAVDAHIRKVF
ncbi:MAG: translocation/assembly module TamB domain-containing protein, partial [Candidatus Acidiferrales bacterium]